MKSNNILFSIVFLVLFLGPFLSIGLMNNNGIDEVKYESNWIEIKVINPNIDEMKMESWIYFETGATDGSTDQDSWTWFFVTRTIYIRYARLTGYKNPDTNEFEVHTVAFQTKFIGNDWSGGLKDFEINIKCGRISGAPDYDYSMHIDPFAQPSDSYTQSSYGWGQFGFYYGDNRLLVILNACYNEYSKAGAQSTVDFNVS
ncbi:MAG: hypothetical protein ACFFDW_00720 [Candidatus Thorarchaeota archaeon]